MPRQNQTPTMTISQSSSYNATWIGYSLAVLVWPALTLSGAELDLVKNGQPHATIVLAQRPTASAQLAAWELQYYLQKISAATLPIVRGDCPVEGNRILVGESVATRALAIPATPLAHQEYLIQTAPGVLVLLGHDGPEFSQVDYQSYGSLYQAAAQPIGTCYAAHAFLENQLGVKWYLPNEVLGEVVPRTQDIRVAALSIRRRPDLPVRSIYPLFINTEKLTFSQWDQRQKFQATWVNPRTSLLYWIRNRMWGGQQHNANHSFNSFDKQFGNSHPEWFSTKSFARMQQLNYQMEVQPCLTATGFRDQVVAIARDYFAGRPEPFPGAYRGAEGRFFSVMPNDNTNMCGCPDCRPRYRPGIGPAGNASHYVWQFVNEVAREVRKTHPQAMISNCAYFNYTVPPEGLIFEPNVAVEFCKFYTYYADPHTQRRDHLRIAEFVDQNQVRFFTTWEYLLKPEMTDGAFPCLVPHVHVTDVHSLQKIGGFQGGKLQYLYLQTYNGTRPAGVAQASPVLDFMNLYWRMKLYDDTTLDIDVALDEYYRSFFGPGAPAMKAFYTAIENRWLHLGGGHDSRSWWNRLGTRAFLSGLQRTLEQAREATAVNTVYRRRVDLIDEGILQHMLKSRARYETTALAEAAPVATSGVARAPEQIPTHTWNHDSTWANSSVQHITRTLKNQHVPQQTDFQLAWDDTWLYLKAWCHEPLVAQLKANTRDPDIGGFSDDSIELFFDPTGLGTTYYQFCITSRGVVYDAQETPKAIGATANINWNSGIKVRTEVGELGWEIRAAIPWESLTAHVPRAGSTWRFNLCRNRFTETEQPPYSAWSPSPAGFRAPDHFGLITLNDAEDRGRLVWHCDFSSPAFGANGSTAPLFGRSGWYENTRYANRGWDTSLSVIGSGPDRRAWCDINTTCPSDVLPMHAVQVAPGVVSVQADFRRGALQNQPTLSIADLTGKPIAIAHAWAKRADLMAIELPNDRRNFADADHGLGNLTAAGEWFGLKIEVDTKAQTVNVSVRRGRGRGRWVPLNKRPLPYYDTEAKGTNWFLALGTYKQQTVENNSLEIDNIRVEQMPVAP
ncbi:MAG: hypothetical protein CMJ70_28220 [Planctomycetaceae bacterium]|nr:hypothetical protein [Planctomycetaceae bacterium]|tara:strand:+ start:251 stop:3460 length:3210 start_codon:yes stop_codon:yes gene_type:complete